MAGRDVRTGCPGAGLGASRQVRQEGPAGPPQERRQYHGGDNTLRPQSSGEGQEAGAGPSHLHLQGEGHRRVREDSWGVSRLKVIRDLPAARAFLQRRGVWEVEDLSPQLARGIARVFGQQLSLNEAVYRILKDVRQCGDKAVLDYTRRIDGVELEGLEVASEEREEAEARVPKDVLDSLRFAAERIRDYQHEARRYAVRDFQKSGLGQRVTPLERVGIYVPGGTGLYPSTVLMTAIPARVAGVAEIALTTPPGKEGQIAPVVLAAANIARVDRVFKVGGAQAIGALAFGTQTIPRVDKIFGPGNVFVQTAKRMVFGVVGIDTIQGPTEAVTIADDSIDPGWCVADLLAQAEHDPESASILITTSSELARKVAEGVEDKLQGAAREAVMRQSLDRYGAIIVVDTVEAAIELSNLYAPEHLSLCVRDAHDYVPMIKNAGALFLGRHSTHVLGDYVAGPSHALPTGGAARHSSALGINDFLKVTSVIALSSKDAGPLLRHGATIARAEGFEAHALALDVRSSEVAG
ncbi:MAG: histidinol dehydrogenase [Chloroflexi bacterium]|nr:histidinol dehydrogenase [Chloroflexota bacterium]